MKQKATLSCSALMVLSLLLLQGTVIAQDTTTFSGWKKLLTLDVTTTQSAYSNSWSGGESGSLNWVSNLNGTAERQFTEKLNYRTTLRASFGQTHTQDEKTRHWSKPRKSTDQLDWEHLGRLTLKAFVDPYAAVRFESQFYNEFGNGVKAYLRPFKVTESAGIARKFYEKEKDLILSRFGLALRQSVKPFLTTADPIKTDDSTFTDGGFESVTDSQLSLHKRVKYIGKLTLYKALFFSRSKDVKGTQYEDDWKAIDVNLENQFVVQVTKVVSVSFYTQLLYDKQVDKRSRLKEVLGLGLLFRLA